MHTSIGESVKFWGTPVFSMSLLWHVVLCLPAQASASLQAAYCPMVSCCDI